MDDRLITSTKHKTCSALAVLKDIDQSTNTFIIGTQRSDRYQSVDGIIEL